jgi:N-acetylmuramoyl-L-alanine amidase
MRRRLPRRSTAVAVSVLCAVMTTAACVASPAAAPVSGSASSTGRSSAIASTSVAALSPPSSASHTLPTTAPRTPGSRTSPSTVRPPPLQTSSHVGAPARARPVIVLDPGHSPTIRGIDPATGLNVSGYENEPEMRDVFAVAELVKAKLAAAGYRVIMTKPTVDTPVLLNQIAATANNAHAALALSIHDQAGTNGGIEFDQGNNIVYYQSVGGYRQAPSGKRTVFTDSRVAALSLKYGQIFRVQRAQAESHPVTLQGNVGYDLGSRGLDPGDMWIVQLLSHVPWIYNEAGGNSAGLSGLNATDKSKYANGLVSAVEHCIPLSR